MSVVLLACALLQSAASDAEAWRIFSRLNPLGADQPAAWESWPSAADTFRKDGADPGPVQAHAHPGIDRFELLSPADFPNLRHIVNGRMVPVTDPLATAQRLIEVRLNPVSYTFIRTGELFTLDGQRHALAQDRVEFPAGSIQLKAAWQPITETQRPRYHTLVVHLAEGGTRLFGLAALNIATKTGAGWLWASFEHTDGPVAGHYYRLAGTQTTYLDAGNRPVLLGNAVLESGLGSSASCMTCHARATLSANGTSAHLAVFAPSQPGVRRGYVGTPDPAWFEHFSSLDFVWSLAQAAEHGPRP